MYVIKDYSFDKEKERIYRTIHDKSCFMLQWYEGSVIPINHPNYYDNRINILITDSNYKTACDINFEKTKYKMNDIIYNKLHDYIENNIERFIKLALTQNNEGFVGGADTLSIKYKSLYLNLCGFNTNSEDEYNELCNLKNEMKNILLQCEEDNGSTIEINYKDLKNTIDEEIVEDDDRKRLIEKLIKQICDLPLNSETNIASLMSLKDDYTNRIDSELQNIIYKDLITICAKLKINLIEMDSNSNITGYNRKFLIK